MLVVNLQLTLFRIPKNSPFSRGDEDDKQLIRTPYKRTSADTKCWPL